MREPRVLVVDDDPDVLSVVGQLLQAYGLKTEIFKTATQLLENLEEDDVGCVVTDLEMPEMSGIELQSVLAERKSSLSVIVITAHADVPRTIEIMGQGAVTLLEKPFKGEQLVKDVERAIEMSRQHRARVDEVLGARRLIQSLSDDELKVLRCALQGMPNKAISLELDMSPRTVDRRRQNALCKLGGVSIGEFALLLTKSKEEI